MKRAHNTMSMSAQILTLISVLTNQLLNWFTLLKIDKYLFLVVINFLFKK